MELTVEVKLGPNIFLNILFIHERQRKRQREKQAPCEEPNAELDPRTLGS